MKFKILAFILLVMSYSLRAQSQASNLIDEFIKTSVEKRPSTAQLKTILEYDNPTELFYAIIPYTSDSVADVRSEAYSLLSKVGLNTRQEEVRKKFVKQLIKGCRDKESSICGKVLNTLCKFSRSDFDSEAAYELSMLTKEKLPYYQLLIKLVGYINVVDVKQEYRTILQEKKYPNTQVRWALHLALARMGEADQADYCVEKVKKLQVNDDLVYDIVPDLIYTRQKKAFDYLLEIIESDEKNCSPSNPDSNAKIICAYRVMEQIAPFIENFPVETNASGDLKTKSYNEALIKVRAWIRANRDGYIIRTDTF